MPDMLVHLLKLPPVQLLIDKLRRGGVIIRRANSFELSRVREFIAAEFFDSWADEASVGFARQPISVFIAIRDGEVIGFGAYECTSRGFFGPTGVAKAERGKDIGKALLLSCLWGLREMGYAYGIVGGAEEAQEFYEKCAGATVIPGSKPGVYADPLGRKAKTNRTAKTPRKENSRLTSAFLGALASWRFTSGIPHVLSPDHWRINHVSVFLRARSLFLRARQIIGGGTIHESYRSISRPLASAVATANRSSGTVCAMART